MQFFKEIRAVQKISFFFGHHCYKYCHYHPSCYCYKYCHYQTYQTILPLNYGMILAPRSWWAAALSPRKHAVFLALLVSGAFLNEKMWISCWIHWNMMIWTLDKLLLTDHYRSTVGAIQFQWNPQSGLPARLDGLLMQETSMRAWDYCEGSEDWNILEGE